MPAVAERAGPIRAAWTALVANAPGRLPFALRLTLACCGTALISLWFEIPDPALSVYLILFLNRPERSTSIVLALVMLAFLSVLIALLFPLTAFLINVPFWRVAAMAVLSFGLIFLGSASRLRPFAASMALITAYVLDLLGSLPGGELATRGLLYAWLFAAVPVAVSVMADLLLAPAPRSQAAALLARALLAAADLLDRPCLANRAALASLYRQVALSVPGLLNQGRREATLPHSDADAFGSAATATMRILAAVELLDRHADAEARAALADALTATLRAMADVLAGGGYPVDIPHPCWPPAVGDDLAPLIVSLSDALAGFATTPAAPAAPPRRPSGFFAADAFTNPVHVRHALKVTLAAMGCYLLYALWDWPGIHTAMITCYVVGLGTAAETVEKLSLRIVGCLLGAALGLATIVFVLPSVTSIAGVLVVVAGGMFLAGWVAAGDARISYAGFQFGFAFLLCTLQGDSPGFDLTVARDRVIGVLLGTAVSYFIFTRISPVSVADRIDPALAGLVDGLQQTAQAGAAERPALATQALAAAAPLGRWLDLARLEPPSLRPAREWIEARQELLARIDRLAAPLLLASPGSANDLDAIAAEVATLAATETAEGE